MAQAGGYREELEAELKQANENSHAYRLLAQEIDRLQDGNDDVEVKKARPAVQMIDIHADRPQKIRIKVRIPAKEHPKYNFVGKLLGPKGATLKELQQTTGCKLAIMGKGSMRPKEKEKEEELRKEGGKYAHLNDELHVLVECYSEATDAYHRIAGALTEVKKFLIPSMDEDMYGGGDHAFGMNGAPRGRGGAFRGGPPAERGRGGRGRTLLAAPVGRGAPRGATRGAPRGAPSARGAPPYSRGARAAPGAGGYDAYGSAGYDSQYEASYDDGYSGGAAYEAGYEESSYPSRAEPSYDYYGGSESYSGGGGYGDGYESGYAAPKAPPSSRGAGRPGPPRSHPYSRGY